MKEKLQEIKKIKKDFEDERRRRYKEKLNQSRESILYWLEKNYNFNHLTNLNEEETRNVLERDLYIGREDVGIVTEYPYMELLVKAILSYIYDDYFSGTLKDMEECKKLGFKIKYFNKGENDSYDIRVTYD